MKRFNKEKGYYKRKNKKKEYKCRRKNSLLHKLDSYRKKSELNPNNKYNMSAQAYWSK